MPHVNIWRILPADVKEVQTQTTNNASINNVIQSLQFNKQTELGSSLNTLCPTCQVDRTPTGYLTTTVGDDTVYYACPTCDGYLRIHTSEGVLDPITNPFGGVITVKRILPADLLQAKNGFSVTALDTLNTALQGNIYNGSDNIPITHNCPNCTHTGWVTVQATEQICPLCSGYQKTNIEYQKVDGVISRVVTPVAPPDPPLPVPIYPPA